MRTFGVLIKGLAVATLLVLAGTFAADAGPKKPPRPATTECQQECYDQFLVDRAACDEVLSQRLADLDAEEAACREQAKDPISLGRCINKVNIKRRVAFNEQRKCYNRANTKAYNCYRQCNASETAP